MRFSWDKYEEIPSVRKNTLQIFITNQCNLKCAGCFARNIIGKSDEEISLEEYWKVVDTALMSKIIVRRKEPI